MQAVDVQLVADFLEEPQLGLAQLAIGRAHVTGQRIGGFKQALGQGLAHKAQQGGDAVFVFEQIEYGLRDGLDPVRIIAREHRQVIDDALDRDQFRCADGRIRRGNGDHDRNQRVLRRQRWGGCVGDAHVKDSGLPIGARLLTLATRGNRKLAQMAVKCSAPT